VYKGYPLNAVREYIAGKIGNEEKDLFHDKKERANPIEVRGGLFGAHVAKTGFSLVHKILCQMHWSFNYTGSGKPG